jgi:hypothetical protein
MQGFLWGNLRYPFSRKVRDRYATINRRPAAFGFVTKHYFSCSAIILGTVGYRARLTPRTIEPRIAKLDQLSRPKQPIRVCGERAADALLQSSQVNKILRGR